MNEKKEQLKVFALRRKMTIIGSSTKEEERLLLTTKFEEIIETYRDEKDKWWFSDFKLFKGTMEEVDVKKLDSLI